MVAKSWKVLAALVVIVALGGCGGPDPSAGSVTSAGGGGDNGGENGNGNGVLVCPCKVTGGGFVFRNGEEEKTTFGFNAQALKGAEFDEDAGGFAAKGQFQINFHEEDSKLHGVVDTIACFPQADGDILVQFAGELKSGGDFQVEVVDEGEPGVLDEIRFIGGGEDFTVRDLGGPGPGGGNLQLHKIDRSKCVRVDEPPQCPCPPCPQK